MRTVLRGAWVLALSAGLWPMEGVLAGEPGGDEILPTPLDIKVIRARHQDMTGTNELGLPITEWWDEDDLARMVFSDPTDITAARSVKRYWEEVSSGGLVVGGSIEPGVIVIDSNAGFKGYCFENACLQWGDCIEWHGKHCVQRTCDVRDLNTCLDGLPGANASCDDPVARLSPDSPDTCLIQGAAGAEPQERTTGPSGDPLTKLECDIARVLDAYLGVGEGYNWLGDEPEDVFVIMFPEFKPDNVCWNVGRGYPVTRPGFPDLQPLFGKRLVFAADESSSHANPYFPEYTVENWMEVQIVLIAHEIGHTLSLGHEDGRYCEVENPDGSWTPVIYSNYWCTYMDLTVPNFSTNLNNRASLMSGSGWHDNAFMRVQDQFHGGHVSMWEKLNNDYSTWVDEDTVKRLDPGPSKSTWTFKLSPAEMDQRDPDLIHYAAAILEINESEQFLLEFRRPAEGNSWAFDQFVNDDPLVNGLLVWKILPNRYWAGMADLLDCNPSETTYTPDDVAAYNTWLYWFLYRDISVDFLFWDWYEGKGRDLMDDGRSHHDAACEVGQVTTFFVQDLDGTDKKVRISVLDMSTDPGDQWLQVEVEVETESG